MPEPPQAAAGYGLWKGLGRAGGQLSEGSSPCNITHSLPLALLWVPNEGPAECKRYHCMRLWTRQPLQSGG